MERLRPSVQLGSIALSLAALALPGTARAQGATERASPAEVVAARELFRQATEDVDAGRFAEGLEKFKRVAAVRETAAVRFNIARCEEALGKIGAALADFELAASEGRDDSKTQDVSKLAGEHADSLRPKVPRLTVIPPAEPPEGLAVSLDGKRLATATMGVGLPIDPGAHVVEATAPGRVTFHVELSLTPGQTKNIDVVLAPGAEAPPLPTTPPPEPSTPTPSSRGSTQRTLGWVAAAAGGAAAIGSGVFMILERNAVAAQTSDCPNIGYCPVSTQEQNQSNSEKSNAEVYKALSIGLIVGGGVALVGGIVLIATAPKDGPAPHVSLTAGAPGATAGLSLTGSF